jgi:broad specificity phosphatase PhoE
MKLKNTYYILRHGQSLKNTLDLSSNWPEKFYLPLTNLGRKQVKKSAKELRRKKIDLIFCSDILRARQTAEIVKKEIGVKPKTDKRLREIDSGVLNGKPLSEARKFWQKKEGDCDVIKHYLRRFYMTPPKAENYAKVEKRMLDFVKEMERKYEGKKIVIISHSRPITLLEKAVYGWTRKKTAQIIAGKKELIEGQFKQLN